MFFKGKENKVQRVNNLPKAIEKMTYVAEIWAEFFRFLLQFTFSIIIYGFITNVSFWLYNENGEVFVNNFRVKYWLIRFSRFDLCVNKIKFFICKN